MDRPGIQITPAIGRDGDDRRAWLWRATGRGHAGRREHACNPQPRRLHLVLVLPDTGARPAAGLVQIGALPRPRRARPARGVEGIRTRAAGRDRSAGVGQHRGAALSRPPERPPGSEGMSEGALAALVSRDAMIGTAKVTLTQKV